MASMLKITRFMLFSPISVLAYLIGIAVVGAVIHKNVQPIDRERPKSYDVHLEMIEVRDEDKSRWNMNGGYLDIFDAVFFDDRTVLALYLQDGMKISHDGGATWQRMFQPSGLPKATGGFTVWDLDFTDRQHGWAGGSCLIKTVDGGETWQNIKLPEWIDNLKIKFLNENTGYVAGRGGSCERGSGECNLWMSVYKTSDGGRTWKRALKTKEGDTPWQIVVVNEEIAMVTFGGGWLYRTTDGGKSWESVISNFYGRVMSISRAPDGKFWMFGTCSVLVSDDLGATWKKPVGLEHDVIHHEWWSVDFNQNGIGVAVSEDAAIALTRDCGLTWKLVTSNLHVNNKIPVPDNPFKEALRGVQLNGNRGIINGSQRDYWIGIPN